MKKVMIGSPICQDSEILKEFLLSLNELKKDDLEVSYCFVDDNKEKASSDLLVDFKLQNNCEVELLNVDLGSLNEMNYHCDENTHLWTNNLIDKVIAFKNKIIERFLESDNDYLFFIDSDIVLDKVTLEMLIEADKDIIANIFWTSWNAGSREEPQVWMKDFYTFYEGDGDPDGVKTLNFFNMLRVPGVYRVGGLGACTLIKRKPLEAGVNFSRIRNISFWGEDRAFCIRAEVLGFDLHVDTRQPAFHIYRKSYLNKLKDFKDNCEEREIKKIAEPAIIATTIIENYDYKIKRTDIWKNYFIDDEIKRMEALILEENGEIEKTAAISIINIETVKGNFIDKENLEVNFNIKRTGYRNWESVDEYYKLTIALVKLEDNSWKIKSYNKEKNIDYKSINIIRKVSPSNKLTLSMIVKNEEGRYLERALKEHRKYIDNALIIDDGSTDKTVQIVKDLLGDCNLTLIENNNSKFSNEINLRKEQWEETIKLNPNWILNLDADEIFEESFADGVKNLINSNIDMDGYSFRLYDFWSENQYRNDKLWYAHNVYRLFLVRYQPNFNYLWKETKQHCGRFPYNCYGLPNGLSNYRLKHFGWSKEEDRINKFKRYMELDPNGEFGSVEQYYSILDPNPNLEDWK